ncbi:MAG: hypothetical protein WBN96_04685 [Gammaproteobacteria bacterium]
MTNYKFLMGMLAAPVLVSAEAVYAIDFIAKAAVGKKSSELIIRDRSFNPDFITLDLSLTGTLDRYFVTINNEFSIKDDIETDPNGLIFYSREDINITIGYSLDQFTVFGGFRSGDTNANYTANNSAFGTTSDGYYIGASKSYFFDGWGNFSGSIAVATLDGEVSLSEPFVDTSAFVVGTPPPSAIKGSAVGVSLALGWSGQVSADTIYNIDLKINQFDFEDDVVFGGLDLSYEENFSTIYLGLTHFFD